jgi:hypothetical protein
LAFFEVHFEKLSLKNVSQKKKKIQQPKKNVIPKKKFENNPAHQP